MVAVSREAVAAGGEHLLADAASLEGGDKPLPEYANFRHIYSTDAAFQRHGDGERCGRVGSKLSWFLSRNSVSARRTAL